MKNILKKAFFVTALMTLLTVVLCFGASALSSSGKCGNNVTYTYNSTTKELIISGKGAMYDYNWYFKSPFYDSDIKSVIIKDGVTTIGDSAFRDCESLTGVTIGNSVTTIGNYAFCDCDRLTRVTIPDSVTTIGDWAFDDCDRLTSVTIGNSVTTIGSNAFYGTAWYDNQSDGVVYAGKVVYDYKGSMPANTSITLKAGTKGVADSALSFCESLTSVTIPDSVTTIGSDAFRHCSRLTSVTIPDSVTTIGSDAFYGTAWYDNQPDGVVYAGKVAYKYKGTMPENTSITIKEGTKGIADSAFSGCSSLTSVTIPDSVTTIGSYAFDDCESLTSITVDEKNKYYSNDDYGVLFDKNKTKLIQYPIGNKRTKYTIPDSVTSAGENAFYKCTGLKKVNITDMAKWCKINFAATEIFESINQYYYDVYSNPLWYGADLYLNDIKVTDVVIPDGIKSIGTGIFAGYKDLVSVTIPSSVTSIGRCAFENCTGIKKVYVSDIAKWCKIEFSYFLHNDDFDGHVYSVESSNPLQCGADLYLNGKKVVNLVIPDGVKRIGKCAFFGWKGLKSITIPDSVIEISSYSTGLCNSLTDIYYRGTQQQWSKIKIEYGFYGNGSTCKDSIKNARKHYNSCGLTHKKIVNVAQQNPTCTKVGYTAGKQCSYCKEWISGHKKLSATGHKYTPGFITKATLTINGKVIMKCSSCGDSYSKATYAVTTISLSSTKYIYDGTNKTPKVTVKDKKGNALVKGKDYKIAVASKRSGVGRYTVKVTLMGNYEGSKNLYFYILPGAPAAVKSAAQSSSAIKLSWSAVKGAAGYTVYRYSPSRSAYVKVVTTSQTSATAKSLSSGTKYIFKVVAYSKTSAGKVYYSEKYTLLKTATKTKTPSLTVTSPSKGEAALKWTNVSGETGYQIYYSTSKNGTYKKYTNCGVNATNGSIYGLTSGKTYYFKIRTYIKTDSGYVYSPFSAVKSVKVK